MGISHLSPCCSPESWCRCWNNAEKYSLAFDCSSSSSLRNFIGYVAVSGDIHSPSLKPPRAIEQKIECRMSPGVTPLSNIQMKNTKCSMLRGITGRQAVGPLSLLWILWSFQWQLLLLLFMRWRLLRHSQQTARAADASVSVHLQAPTVNSRYELLEALISRFSSGFHLNGTTEQNVVVSRCFFFSMGGWLEHLLLRSVRTGAHRNLSLSHSQERERERERGGKM